MSAKNIYGGYSICKKCGVKLLCAISPGYSEIWFSKKAWFKENQSYFWHTVCNDKWHVLSEITGEKQIAKKDLPKDAIEVKDPLKCPNCGAKTIFKPKPPGRARY